MNKISPQIKYFHESILQQTRLSQMCGTQELFCDRYEIVRILGRGGFGITYLAKNAILPGQPWCVIKQLSPKVTNTSIWEKAYQRFEKEAQTLAKLGSHPQIPMLLDYFEVNGTFYLVQEYIHGYNLAYDVKRNGLKNEAEVKQFLKEILPVLEYLHENQIMHRDIKPQNLLRCKYDQRFVLIDFGAVKEELADVCKNSLDSDATCTFVGTIGFAPPEQFSLRSVYASDIYALGMTCLYLLTGKGPLEFAYDHNTDEVCWQKEVKVSNSFAKILGKMLKISLKDRFQTIDEVKRALDLEEYVPSLTQCLTIQSPKINNKTKVKEPTSQKYVPYIQRTAIAIREWKEKRQAKEAYNNLQQYLH
ncbi:serine/threonine protein kinase [Calothrix sp. FACHB-156]|nr:serine/threonine protein kinase [Calothrix sp. FACHB-156]